MMCIPDCVLSGHCSLCEDFNKCLHICKQCNIDECATRLTAFDENDIMEEE